MRFVAAFAALLVLIAPSASKAQSASQSDATIWADNVYITAIDGKRTGLGSKLNTSIKTVVPVGERSLNIHVQYQVPGYLVWDYYIAKAIFESGHTYLFSWDKQSRQFYFRDMGANFSIPSGPGFLSVKKSYLDALVHARSAPEFPVTFMKDPNPQK
jgi:hypothetical protein